MSSELSIDTAVTGADAIKMANAIFGSGVTVVNASFTGAAGSAGVYSGGDATADDVLHSDSGVILSTGKVADFTSGANPSTNPGGDPNLSSGTTTQWGTSGNAALSNLAGQQTFDAAVLTSSFIPDGNMITMQIVFSSEEYLEYVGTNFNDVVGIWVNGVQAELTVGTGEIAINNINTTSNQNLYIDNAHTADVYNTEMDGFTVVLTLKAPVNDGQVNTISFAIADAGDAAYDSNLVILGNSVQSALVANDDDVHIGKHGVSTIDVLSNDFTVSGGTLTITHINGIEVTAGSTVVLSTGETLTLNANGTMIAVSSGTPKVSTFSYTVEDQDGVSDVAFVNVTTAPCFVAGTLIDVPGGRCRVEDLRPGDLVMTRDNGPQPLRWAGRTRRRALGADAPVRLAAGALGQHRSILLSRNHRVLVQGPVAEMLFGVPEVLVKAGHLVNDATIRPVADGREVTYVHLMFERHQIVVSNGLPSESYHPGDGSMDSFDQDARAEILSLFPELQDGGLMAYGPTARPVLRRHEAALLGYAAA